MLPLVLRVVYSVQCCNELLELCSEKRLQVMFSEIQRQVDVTCQSTEDQKDQNDKNVDIKF